MIELVVLDDDCAALQYSPLLRAARLTLEHADENDGIGLTQTKAFKRTFVKWAAEKFDWPGMSSDDLFRHNKVLNEYDFPPLELLHFLLLELKLGRHYKGHFRITKKGKKLVEQPGRLFDAVLPFFLLNVDHGSYSRFGDMPFGNWDTWLNVLNVEMDQGATDEALCQVFYGEDTTWREKVVFASCVLTPLEWAGLVFKHDTEVEERMQNHYFKTPLWRAVLKLSTDDRVLLAKLH